MPTAEDMPACLACGASLDPEDVYQEVARLERRRSADRARSSAFGLPGLVLVLAGCALLSDEATVLWGVVAWFVGFALFAFGLGYLVLYKRDNIAWLLLMALGLVGILVLVCLPDSKGRRLARLRRFLVSRGEERP